MTSATAEVGVTASSMSDTASIAPQPSIVMATLRTR